MPESVDDAGAVPYGYLDGSDSLKKAHDRFGGPKGLLGIAAQILGNSEAAAYKGNDPKAAGDISRISEFARSARLMVDAQKGGKMAPNLTLPESKT